MDLEAMEAGASDYLLKSAIDPEKLERSIRYTLNRNNTLQALKASESRYRNIFDRSRDMIYVTDSKGNILTVNASATRIFGYSIEEFREMNAKDLFLNLDDHKSFVDSIIKFGITSNYELALKDKNNNTVFCIVSGSTQRDEVGNKINYQGIIHNITRRKKAEKEVIIAEKLAVTGKVVRTLAHEIRNPLTNINLSVDQLEYDNENEELSIYFNIIKRNSKRINDIISELLQSSNPAEVNMKPTSIKVLLDETLALAIDRIILKNITVERNYEDDISIVKLDAAIMKVALLNIIVNAIEAMPDAGGVLKIHTFIEENKCYIKIIDNGSGIGKENIGHLFEPYFTGKANGIGLGLATTHNIIGSHNGSIEVESDQDSGTQFIIGLNLES